MVLVGLSFRHSGESSHLVIPAEAGIHLLFLLTFWALTRKPTHVPVLFRPPSWRPGHFLCLPRESNQREGTRVGRRLRRFATGGRGSADGTSCAAAE